MNMALWLFDQCIFSLVPFAKDRVLTNYEFTLVPFWIKIYNVPLECMERLVAMDVGSAVEEVLAIDLRDNKGCSIKYMRV